MITYFSRLLCKAVLSSTFPYLSGCFDFQIPHEHSLISPNKVRKYLFTDCEHYKVKFFSVTSSHQSQLSQFTSAPPSQRNQQKISVTSAWDWVKNNGPVAGMRTVPWPFSSEHMALTSPKEHLFCQVSWEVWVLVGWRKTWASNRGPALLGGSGWLWVEWKQSRGELQRAPQLHSDNQTKKKPAFIKHDLSLPWCGTEGQTLWMTTIISASSASLRATGTACAETIGSAYVQLSHPAGIQINRCKSIKY